MSVRISIFNGYASARPGLMAANSHGKLFGDTLVVVALFVALVEDSFHVFNASLSLMVS